MVLQLQEKNYHLQLIIFFLQLKLFLKCSKLLQGRELKNWHFLLCYIIIPLKGGDIYGGRGYFILMT